MSDTLRYVKESTAGLPAPSELGTRPLRLPEPVLTIPVLKGHAEFGCEVCDVGAVDTRKAPFGNGATYFQGVPCSHCDATYTVELSRLGA